MQRYSPNPEINAKIHTLLRLGVPPIPVAPKLDPKHPDGHRVESPEYKYREDKPELVSCNGERVQVSGDYCKITTTAVGCDMAPVRGEFVRLDNTLTPTGQFTGKNPSYLDWDGKHRKLNHGQFQKRMPTEQELKRWFCNPDTGIGTLGGHNGIDWIDFDAKNYPTQEDCDRDVQALLDRIGKPTLTEKTGSGGYRVAVIPTVKPTFTNFSTEPGGKHLGEALFAGRFTVLAPSKHPNGNYYRELCDANPVEVESLESIGLYPSKDETETQKRAEKRSRKQVTQGTTPNTKDTTFSDPADNPWDIRNFAQFLEGYSERGDGWGSAKCPAHNGTSLTSFRVRLDTGEYKLWCGCNTKAVFKAAKELAERFGYKPEIKAFTPDTRTPDVDLSPEEYQALQQRYDEEEFAADAEEKERQKVWRDQYPDRVKSHYNRHRRYTPTDRQNNRFVEFDTPAPNTIMGVRSHLGSGKTEKLIKIKEYLSGLGEGGLLFADRNGLLYQTCERLGIQHLQRDKAWKEKQHSDSWLALCPDSLIHFTDEELHGRNVIIDEAMAFIETLLMGKTLTMKRDKVINRFEYLIKNAKRIFLLDGHLADWAVDYIAKIRGGYVNITKVGNEFIAPRPPVEFLTGSVNSFGKLLKRDYTSFLTQLLPKQIFTLAELDESSTEGKRRSVMTIDTQVGAEALDKLLTSLDLIVLRIDSKTVQQSHIKAICNNPNDYFRNHPEIDAFIYTPTLENGFDVSVTQTVERVDTVTGKKYYVEMPYFTDVYGIFVGTLTTDRQIQMLGRVRQCNRIHVFCVPFAPTSEIHSQFANAATKDLIRYISNDAASITADGLTAEFEKCKKTILENKNSPHQEAWGILKSTQNYQKSNLRECLKEALIQAGHTVNEVSANYNKEHAGRWHNSKIEVKKQNSADGYNADDITLERAEELSTNYSSSWEEQRQIWKALTTQKYLPGIADSASWSEDFCYWIEYEQRKWIKQQELFWLLHHPEVALLMQQQRWSSRVKRSQTFLPDIRSRYSQVKALRSIGIQHLIESAPGKLYHKDSPEIISFISRLTPALQSALGFKAGNSADMQVASRVLNLIGYELKCQRQQRVDGKRVRYYSIQPINKKGTGDYRADTLVAIERKWGNYIQNAQPVDWGVSEDKTVSVDTPAISLVNITKPGVTQRQHYLFTRLFDVVFWLNEGLDVSAATILHGILREEETSQVWEAINQHPELKNLESLISNQTTG